MTDDAVVRCQDAVAEGEVAARRADALRRNIADERSAVSELRLTLAQMETGLRRLGRLSVARLRARMAGDLDQRVAAAKATVEHLHAEIAVRQQALDQLHGDLNVAWERARRRGADKTALAAAIAEHQQRLIDAGGVHSEALAAVQQRSGELSIELREVSQALAALRAAQDALVRVREKLASARGWSGYDTWFGGGLIGSTIKHRRLDDASNHLVQAHHALMRLRSELADANVWNSGLSVGVSPTLRAFDIWFDNIISDWKVHNRIQLTQEAVDHTIHRLGDVRRRLQSRDAALRSEIGEISGRRAVLMEFLTSNAQPN